MKLTTISLFALACGLAPLAAPAGVEIGVNFGGPEVVVHSQPPPERYEAIGTAPGPGYFWVRGHWGWHHEHWEWVGGRWEHATQPNSVWVAGQWVQRGNGYVWVEGHYDVVAPPPPPPSANYEVVVNDAPPAPIEEAVPYAPGPDYFWIGGHWSWSGRWVWVHGRYDRHPHFHPGGGWEAGHWDRRDGGRYVWREGHWR
jgi:WXXGXW repeat (2 copies)